jgi:sulfane dehydrogenase subunit SoxC
MNMIPSADLHEEPLGVDAWSPIGELAGTITPSPLHYVSSHGSVPPDIDPALHRLMIYGMVDRPLVFTVDELKRLPAVSRIHYIECVVNGPIPAPEGRTLNQMHGMISCSEWTGVPLSLLLKEAGVRGGAQWILAEGAEANQLSTSVPMGKALDDVFVAYAQNGEPVRPYQGFPLRLVCPGFQGKYQVKWLKGINVSDRPYMTYWERGHFMGSARRDGNNFLEQGPKSVITFPSGEQRLPGRGFYAISGLAWSGCGSVSKVEVSTDGGRTWNAAQVQEPVHRIALTRFTFPWTWNGEEAVLQSRCIDDQGQVQPSRADERKFWGNAAGHRNPIQPWRVTREGNVLNAF